VLRAPGGWSANIEQFQQHFTFEKMEDEKGLKVIENLMKVY